MKLPQYFESSRLRTLYLLGLLSASASFLSAEELSLTLSEVTAPSSMAGLRGPAVLFLEFEGGGAVTARVMIPYGVADGDYKDGNAAVFDVNAAGLSIVGDSLSGSASATVREAGAGGDKTLSVTLAATVDGDTVTGTYAGAYGGTAISGEVRGSSVGETVLPPDPRISLQLNHPSTPLRVWFALEGGSVVEAEATANRYRASVYNAAEVHVVRNVGPRGDLDWGMTLEEIVSSTSDPAVAIGTDSFTASFTASIPGVSGGGSDYVLSGRVIGTTIVGTYSILENGIPVYAEGSFIGYLGSGDTVPAETLPVLTPLVPAADNEGNGFTPPYYAGSPVTDLKQRLLAAALWLTSCPELEVFASDATSTSIGATGGKQYDNAALNSYGGAVAFGLLNRLSDDPALRAFALESAARAGYWVDAQGLGNYGGLARYYKNMVFVSAWGALGHMDLYEATGEERWLDAVVGYLSFLEDQITTRMVSMAQDFPPDDGVPGGRTWLMLDPETGGVGKSNLRDDRTWDNYELHPMEFLWLLGKVRVDHGINTFATFEANAYQWVLDNLDDSYIWNFRPNDQPATPQTVGPTLFALYLLDYQPGHDPAVLDQTIQHIEATHIDWRHPVTDDGLRDAFLPSLRDYYPRQISGYLPVNVASTAATSRMALVYLKRFQHGGDPDDLAKAQALALAVLDRQNLETGLIHHLGAKNFSEDHLVRLFVGPNGVPPDSFGNPKGQIDQHPYTGLKANTLRNLYDYVVLLESLGLDCVNPQVITTPGIIQKDLLDPPFSLSATASSGLPVSYELVYGPASLDGDEVTLDGFEGVIKIIASQEGDGTWCAAAAKAIFIAVGDQVPAQPLLPGAQGIDTTSVQVVWSDESDNETYFRIEYREQGASEWALGGIAQADTTTFTVTGLSNALVYDFRILAANQVSFSAPSDAVTASPIEQTVYLFAEVECVDSLGPVWTVIPNQQAGGGIEMIANFDQKDRDNLDPSNIIDYFFDIPFAATYYLWVRGYTTAGGSSDSIWLKVDDGIHVGTGTDTFYSHSIYNTGSYGWQVNGSSFYLEPGLHKVTLTAREEGAVIDRIMLTTDSTILTGYGIGGDAFNCGGAEEEETLLLEATLTEGIFNLQFYGETGFFYQVESIEELGPNWEPEDDLVFDGADAELIVPVGPPTETQFFYRVVRYLKP